jgi:hypothetical protein
MDIHGIYLKGTSLYCKECLKVVMAVSMINNINICGSVNTF